GIRPRQYLAQEKPCQSLQATSRVYEANLRLVGTKQIWHWNCRGHFFAAAGEAMRRILIDNARRKQAEKHGGGLQRVDLDRAEAVAAAPPEDLLALDEALERLTRHDATAAQLVKLHYFAGLSVEEAGEVLGLSRTSAYRLWTFVRAWLRCQLSNDGAAPGR